METKETMPVEQVNLMLSAVQVHEISDNFPIP